MTKLLGEMNPSEVARYQATKARRLAKMKEYRKTPESKAKEREKSRARREKTPTPPRNQIPCAICSSMFTPRFCATTCSHECGKSLHRERSAARNRRNAPTPDSRACIVCGGPFATRRSKQLTCGPGCSATHAENQHKSRRASKPVRVRVSTPKPPKPVYSRTCVACGTLFDTTMKNRLTCSTECSESHSRQLVKDLRAKRNATKPPRSIIPKPAKEPKPVNVLEKKRAKTREPKVKAIKQTPTAKACKPFQRQDFGDCGVGPDWDRPRPLVEPAILTPPPFTPTVAANVVFSGPVIERKVVDWRKAQF